MASLDDPLSEEVGENFEEEEEEVPELNEPHQEKKGGRKKRDATTTLRKAPQAPKRFKSSYICFFMAKQPEIKAELGEDANVTSISKRSAEMWKNLPPEERAHWDDVAAKDKQRYMNEKATYTGPWQVPWKRVRKDPSAPRRPMSAFLFYSIRKRQEIKEKNPELKNTEISRILGDMWRSLTDEERRPFIEKEKVEREKYKVAIAEWRKNAAEKKEAQRKAQAEQAAAMVSIMEQQQQMYQDQYGGQVVAPTPFMYPGYPAAYPYPAGPYMFPLNGKQPVILGPNGMPHYQQQMNTQTSGHAQAPAMPPPNAFPHGYDDGTGPGVSFDYAGSDHVSGENTG